MTRQARICTVAVLALVSCAGPATAPSKMPCVRHTHGLGRLDDRKQEEAGLDGEVWGHAARLKATAANVHGIVSSVTANSCELFPGTTGREAAPGSSSRERPKRHAP